MTINTLFPEATLGRGGNEANGLSQDVEPKNCVIINKFRDKFFRANQRRDHYLVSLENKLIHLRICQASPDSGYACFAVILETANNSEQKEALILKCKRMREAFRN